ncbi:hypothetical protein [Inconstantimicrobium mannanitabidum]|uniref:Uncharacterized protein n=1 Tax=Inconstantimicrobium mannanitabidum TaxID=1604901 RepID=A0ACB5RCT8_9CLOT|nr:hypothetical protein [Clostridium sp. TW13]GKX67087.1 hypothetical protein rsdtw13_23450 [Clostridium sp. TW13]
MKNKASKARWILRGVFLLLFICSIYLVYDMYHSYFRTAPSEKWAKAVKIAEGIDIDKAKVLKFNDKNIVVYNEKENVKVLLIDKLGKVIKNSTIRTEDDFIINLNLATDGKSIYVSWIKTKNSEKYMETHVLDENLNDIKKIVEIGVQSIKTLNSQEMLLEYKDKLQIKNVKENKSIEVNVPSDIVGAIKTKDGYIITSFHDYRLSYITIKNGKINIKSNIARFTNDGKTVYSDLNINADGKFMYVLLQRGVDGTVLKITYDLNTDKVVDRADFQYQDITTFNSVVTIPYINDVRFLMVVNKMSDVEEKSESQVVELTLKDNVVKNMASVSKNMGFSQVPDINGDTVVFRNINGNKKTLYITASNDEFIKANNIDRNEEKILSRDYTTSKVITSILSGVLMGIKWIIAGIILMAIMIFAFLDRYYDKYKKPYYIISYAVVSLIKIFTIYNVVYSKGMAKLPNVIESPIIGVFLLALISILCGTYAYIKYTKDLDQLSIISFIEGVAIDTVLTATFFVSYIQL